MWLIGFELINLWIRLFDHKHTTGSLALASLGIASVDAVQWTETSNSNVKQKRQVAERLVMCDS